MTTFLVFMLILSVLVLIHEFGHFFVARKNGVKIEEFGFGLPPKLFGKKYGETEYSLNLLPFGGFVRLLGEEDLKSSEDPRNFMSKAPLRRAAILVAGVFMNILLAFALYYVFFISNGFKSLTIPLFFDYNFRFGNQTAINTVVTATQEDSPAVSTGIERGEAIIEVNGVPVYNVTDVRREVNKSQGDELRILLMDVRSVNQDLRTVSITPDINEDGQALLGVLLSKAVTLDYSRTKLLSAPMHSYNMLAYTKSTFSKLISMSFEEKSVEPVSSSVSGPVGIFSVVGSILNNQGKDAVLGLIDLTAMLSLSLAFLNILPFPALDGGRLLFIGIEVLRGKPISASTEAVLHKWGMLLLLLFLVLVTFKDIRVFILG